MAGISFDESLVLKLEGMNTDKEVLTALADHLYEEGYVTKDYNNSILEREEMFPTGLSTGAINIAIPHADIKNVKKGALCVGITDQPVKFNAMDEPDHKIDVSIIIMMALEEAHGHMEMLRKAVELIKNQNELKKILNAKDSKSAHEILASHLI